MYSEPNHVMFNLILICLQTVNCWTRSCAGKGLYTLSLASLHSNLLSLIAAMLQKVKAEIEPLLEVIFKSAITLSSIPKSCRRVKVVFKPKAGRNKHETANDFRPLSLITFVLKTMERIRENYVCKIATRGSDTLSSTRCVHPRKIQWIRFTWSSGSNRKLLTL